MSVDSGRPMGTRRRAMSASLIAQDLPTRSAGSRSSAIIRSTRWRETSRRFARTFLPSHFVRLSGNALGV